MSIKKSTIQCTLHIQMEQMRFGWKEKRVKCMQKKKNLFSGNKFTQAIMHHHYYYELQFDSHLNNRETYLGFNDMHARSV